MSEQRTRVVPGWDGRYFEDFAVGDVYRHPLGRTVLPTDNSRFTLLTQNTAPLHFDAYYAGQTSWKRPLVDSTFTLALVTGQSVPRTTETVLQQNGQLSDDQLAHTLKDRGHCGTRNGDAVRMRRSALIGAPGPAGPD
jgi:acyl dehydratase